ncbi:hypothetical protein [Paraburkholderia unamae]|nr:hypothetical protein [Paraburkholderia unamae]
MAEVKDGHAVAPFLPAIRVDIWRVPDQNGADIRAVFALKLGKNMLSI